MNKRKVTLYFDDVTLSETTKEALRLDRSLSWLIQTAWRVAREEVKQLPSAIPTVGQGQAMTGGEPAAKDTQIDGANSPDRVR